MSISNRLRPVKPGSGFSMEGYHIWCGSVLHEDNHYYLFASRWPEETGFPEGYMTHSEIVLAKTDSLNQPFEFVKVLLPGRGDDHWDGGMTHNPFIMKIDKKYVLFYIGTVNGSSERRAIGYACASRPEGPWTRSEEPLTLPPNANNPALIQRPDGSVLLYFRDGQLHVSVAEAERFEGPYTVLAQDIFPKGPIEDMYVLKTADGYEMIAEDAVGAYTGLNKGGVLFRSRDGIHWDNEHPELAYTFDVDYEDGRRIVLQRRERPMLLSGNEGEYLFTTAKIGGSERLRGGKTWNMVQPLAKD